MNFYVFKIIKYINFILVVFKTLKEYQGQWNERSFEKSKQEKESIDSITVNIEKDRRGSLE